MEGVKPLESNPMENINRPSLLLQIATQAMRDKGFEPDYPPAALQQLSGIQEPSQGNDLKDLTGLLWCSIDNDDSRDLDQLTVAENPAGSSAKIYGGVADVDELVKRGTPLDEHARHNTTTVYTGVKTFPMLPEKLSTNLTSLNEKEKRMALVVEMNLDGEGQVASSSLYRAWVLNKAKLTYNGVGAWLENRGPLPPAAAKVQGLSDNLKWQD